MLLRFAMRLWAFTFAVLCAVMLSARLFSPATNVVEFRERDVQTRVESMTYVEVNRRLAVHTPERPLLLSEAAPNPERRVIATIYSGYSNIFIVQPDGTQQRLAPSNSHLNERTLNLLPLWSPDGAWISFSSMTTDANMHPYLVAPEAQTLTALPLRDGYWGVTAPRWMSLRPSSLPADAGVFVGAAVLSLLAYCWRRVVARRSGHAPPSP